MKDLAKFNKFWVALAAPLGVLLFVLAPTDTQTAFELTREEWYQVVVALAAAGGVWAVPNKS